MAANPRPSTLLLGGTAALFAVLILLLVRQNRALKSEVSALRTQLAESTMNQGAKAGFRPSLQLGEAVTGLQLMRPDRTATSLAFPHDGPTMLFMLGRHCGYCDQATPIYEDILREHVAGVAPTKLRVIGVIADAPPPDDASDAGKAAWTDAFSKPVTLIPSFAVPDGPKTWLLKVNATPAAVLLDKEGKVLGVWRGEVTKERAEEMRTAMTEALAAH